MFAKNYKNKSNASGDSGRSSLHYKVMIKAASWPDIFDSKGCSGEKVQANLLYKTQMCKFGNDCRFKKKCRFAHVHSELRTPEENAAQFGRDHFKKKLCRNYQSGMCQFGEACTFLHMHQEDLDRRLPVFKWITGI